MPQPIPRNSRRASNPQWRTALANCVPQSPDSSNGGRQCEVVRQAVTVPGVTLVVIRVQHLTALYRQQRRV